jgi:hypothetical protein
MFRSMPDENEGEYTIRNHSCRVIEQELDTDGEWSNTCR